MKKINIAVIGLDFGRYFATIYAHHPNVDRVIVVDRLEERVNNFLKENGKENIYAYSSFEEVLNDSTVDAVHVCTGIPDHADHSVAVLKAGKHCACAVPMADSLEGIKK